MVSDYDDELANVEDAVDATLDDDMVPSFEALRWGLYYRIVNGISVLLCILAAWVPLKPIAECLTAFAGHETKIDVSIAITLSVVATLTAVDDVRKRRRVKRLSLENSALRLKLEIARSRTRGKMKP